jgi:hypothetical protein
MSARQGQAPTAIDPAAAVNRLAAALRNGTEARRLLPALAGARQFGQRLAPDACALAWKDLPPGPDVPELFDRNRANLLGSSSGQGRGLLLRCCLLPLRLLLWPWLSAQTAFNQHLCDVLHQLTAFRVRQLQFNKALVAELQEPLESTLLALQAEVGQESRLQSNVIAQLRELREAVQFLLQRFGSLDVGLGADPGGDLGVTGAWPRSELEEIFLFAHLPPPPARVLSLTGPLPAALATSGYSVEQAAAGATTAGTFDVATLLGDRAPSADSLRQAARCLRPGGLLLAGPVAELPPGFEVVKSLYLLPSEGGWVFSPEGGPGAVALVVASLC